jgi:hypothetical protein
MVILYPQLLSGNDLPVYLPSLVLNMNSALPGTRPYSGCAIVRRGMVGPWFLFRVIGRMLVGLAFGKTGNGFLPPDKDEQAIAVGMDAIEVAKTKDQ